MHCIFSADHKLREIYQYFTEIENIPCTLTLINLHLIHNYSYTDVCQWQCWDILIYINMISAFLFQKKKNRKFSTQENLWLSSMELTKTIENFHFHCLILGESWGNVCEWFVVVKYYYKQLVIFVTFIKC